MERLLIKNIALGTGGTQSIAVTAASANDDLLYPAYRLTGSPVLVSDLTLAASGTPSLNMGITLYWEANVDVVTNSKSVIIFGKTLPTSWATKNFIATCVYDGSAWQVQLVCGGEEDGWIETSDIADEAVTVDKMADLARGHLLIGNSSTRPVAVDFNNSGYIGIGDGTDYNSVAQSGDVIFSNAGVSAIQPGVIVNADINASAGIVVSKLAGGAASGQMLITNGTTPTWTTLSGDATLSATGVLNITATSVVKTVKLTIPTASVLTLYTTPLTIIAAPGAGYAIEVISAAYRLRFNSIAYATNTTLRLIQDTADVPVGSSVSTALAATITQMSDLNGITNPTSGQTKIIENKALKVQVGVGDPTAGNSDVDIYVTYRLITL